MSDPAANTRDMGLDIPAELEGEELAQFAIKATMQRLVPLFVKALARHCDLPGFTHEERVQYFQSIMFDGAFATNTGASDPGELVASGADDPALDTTQRRKRLLH
jgi:hypothetical protein